MILLGGQKEQGGVYPGMDSRLVYRVVGVFEADSLPQWNVVCLEVVVEEDLEVWEELVKVYLYEGSQG